MCRIKKSEIPNGILKIDEVESWLHFMKLNEKMPKVTVINQELVNKAKKQFAHDHPLVTVFGNHAVSGFNQFIKKHVKEGQSNNLRHHEVIDCKYQRFKDSYCFYMTIEAIEEGILGVYESIVECYTIDGGTRLVQFILTNRRPSGKMSTRLGHLNSLIFKYTTMKGAAKDAKSDLAKAHKAMEGKDKSDVETELIFMKEKHDTFKGICKMLRQQIRSKTPEGLNCRSISPDRWHVPGYNTTCLVKRSEKLACEGYDYKNHSRAPRYW